MKHFLFVFILLSITLSCGNDDEMAKDPNPTVLFSDIDIVTGMQLRDENGSPIGAVGNPNINPQATAIYPNPGQGIVSVYSPNSLVESIWILPGIQDTTFMDIDFANEINNINYTQSEIEALDILNIDINAAQVNLNLQELENGYYRVFYQLENGELKWDNIYINKELTGTDIVNELFEDWP